MKAVVPEGRAESHRFAPTEERTISHSLPFVDVVRGWASILVVVSHVGPFAWPHLQIPFFSLGALAVDFFIIVSGFLMTVSLCEGGQPKPVDSRRLLSFYGRRFFRISPAFYVAYGASLFLAPAGALNILLHFTYLNGLFPAYADNSVISTFWSISLEMQFYLVAPFLLASFRRMKAWWVLAGACLVNLVSSQLWGVYGQPGPLGSFFHAAFLPLSLGLFVTGIVLALHFIKSPHAPSFGISAALILAAPFLHPSFTHAYLAAASAFAVLCWIAPPWPPITMLRDAVRGRLSFAARGKRVAKLLADYSYSLYLFHYFVVIWISKNWSGADWFESLPRVVAFFVVFVVTMGATYAVSFVTLALVERPGVWVGKKFQLAVSGHRSG